MKARYLILGPALLAAACLILLWSTEQAKPRAPVRRSSTERPRPSGRTTANEAPRERAPASRTPGATAIQDALTHEPRRSGAVVIRLVDADGAPVPGIHLEVTWRLSRFQGGQDAGTTDASGRFRTSVDKVEDLHHVSLYPRAKGADQTSLASPVTLDHSGPFVADPERPGEVRIACPGPARITGCVRNPEGNPVRGVGLALEGRPRLALDPGVNNLTLEPTLEACSGEDGRFSFQVWTGEYLLRVVENMTASPRPNAGTGDDADPRPQWQPIHAALISLSRAQPAAEIDLQIADLRGNKRVVVELEGLKVEEARAAVWLEPLVVPKESPTESGGAVRILTDKTRQHRRPTHQSGPIFVFEGLSDAAWTLVVRAPGFEPVDMRLPKGEAVVRVHLQPAARVAIPAPEIEGLVLSDGAPVVGAEVLLLRGSDLGQVRSLRTGRDGAFRASASIVAEDHVFAFAVVGGATLAGSGPIDLRAPKPVKLTLSAPARVEGRVVDADGIAVDAHVSLHLPWRFVDGCDRDGFIPRTLRGQHRRTGSGGDFAFPGHATGPGLIWAVPVDPSLPPSRVAVRPGEPVVIVLGHGLQRSVHAVGAITEMRTGRALQDVDIEVVRAQGLPAIGTLEGRSRPDGSFDLRGIAPGRFHLRFSRKGYAFRRTPMTTHEAGKLSLRVELREARLIPVQVVDPSGLGLRGLYVEVHDAAGRIVELQDGSGRWQADAVATDGNGRADLRGVPAEQVRIVVRDAGASGPGDAILGERAVDLSRPPTGLLQVRAVRR